MDNLLTLNPVEEFELWLEALVVHYRHTGKPTFPSKLVTLERNYRDELLNALHVIQDVLERCPKILESEFAAENRELEFKPTPGVDLKEQIRGDEVMGKRLADFLNFWDFLVRYRVLGASMARNTQMSRQEFKAFGSILADQIAAYCRSEAHAALTRRHQYAKYQHVIQRDIIHSVEIEGSREELERLFHQFFRVLSTVDYFQKEMQRSFKYQKLVILLLYCHFSYMRLLKVLEQAHQYLGYCQPQFAEGLASIKFALRMEVRRIFGTEFQNVGSDQKIDDIYSQMDTALGLLRNASQQSFTSLVHFFNPDFNEMDLFRELRRAKVDSARLLDDLNDIYAAVINPEARTSEDAFQEMMGRLQDFQEGSMRVLFFKDWKPFEQFHQEFKAAEVRERAFILHRFEVFLSTLIGEVAKRSILTRASNDAGELRLKRPASPA